MQTLENVQIGNRTFSEGQPILLTYNGEERLAVIESIEDYGGNIRLRCRQFESVDGFEPYQIGEMLDDETYTDFTSWKMFALEKCENVRPYDLPDPTGDW